jgi:hypothetical protein
MKHSLTALSLALAVAIAPAFAVDEQKANEEIMRQNVGIGLGTMIWSNAGTGLIPQIFAATTNGTFGNQTFAVTSGTSNAKKYNGWVSNQVVRDYVTANLDNLARDMAMGKGETLEGLAELAKIPEADRAAFYAAAQRRFNQVFVSGDVTADQVLVTLDTLNA